MSIRILLVDDFEPWRRLVCSMVKKERGLKVICEASDGLEAIEKAAELRPDLILLDIGLPEVNGIQAARRIRKVSPSSKIVFLSMDNSSDVVQAALGAGAQGFVHKTRVRRDLLPAIEAILREGQFPTTTPKPTTSLRRLIRANESDLGSPRSTHLNYRR